MEYTGLLNSYYKMQISRNIIWNNWEDCLPEPGHYFFIIGHHTGYEEWGLQSLAHKPDMFVIRNIDSSGKEVDITRDNILSYMIFCKNCSTVRNSFWDYEIKYWIYVEDLMPLNYKIPKERYLELLREEYPTVTENTLIKLIPPDLYE